VSDKSNHRIGLYAWGVVFVSNPTVSLPDGALLIPTPSAIAFDSANCSGSPFMYTDLTLQNYVFPGTGNLFSNPVVRWFQGDSTHTLYASTPGAAPVDGGTLASFRDLTGACQNSPSSGIQVVPATVAGSFDVPDSQPWKISVN
jgi:hypothetical protein